MASPTLSSSHNVIAEGDVAAGSAPAANPISIAGFDGTNVQRIRTDTNGNIVTVHKTPITLTSTPLTANSVYTQPAWNDSSLDGSVYITVLAYADQASATNGLIIQETDDTGNSNMFRTVNTMTVAASTLVSFTAAVRSRYWRVQYTNGGTNQTSFELTCTAANIEPFAVNTGGTLQAAQSGTWSMTQIPATSGGATLAKVLSAGSTNATSVKASAGQVYSYALANANAAFRYVHFYNKASAPTVGTDVPVFTVGVPPNFVANCDFNSGTPFTTGIAYSITTGAADNDSGAVSANDVTGFILYK